MAKIFLAMPCAKHGGTALGGQVTAARGLLDFLESKRFEYELVDTAIPGVGRTMFSRNLLRLQCWCSLMLHGLFSDCCCALFFKSTNAGLLGRYLPALLFHLRGKKVGLFFRNSSIFSVRPGSLLCRWVSLLLKPYSVFFVQGEAWREHLLRMGFSSSQVAVIPNWLPPEFSIALNKRPVPTGRLRFVFTGRVVKEKGVFEILQALNTKELDNDCECVFAGTGPDLETCQAIVRERGIKHVTFAGGLPPGDVSALLKSSDVLVLPTFHPEGFPNSILEAMASGLPVVSTNVGAITESVKHGENGLIVESGSASDVWSAMRFYVDSPGYVSLHSAAAIEIVSRRHGRDPNCSLVLSRLLCLT